MLKWLGSGLLAVALLWGSMVPARAQAPKVVASIQPVHAMAMGVLAGIGRPDLLSSGASSPHTLALRPSDARKLAEADLVFWVGESLEPHLARVLPTMAPKAQRVSLLAEPGLKLLPMRRGEEWQVHDHGQGEGHDHEHGPASPPSGPEGRAEAHDPHIWLDPLNMKVIVGSMVRILSQRDPERTRIYEANGRLLHEQLDKLDAELRKALSLVNEKSFVVFHDAFQYMEHRYGLKAVGAVTLHPEQPPGARRILEIRDTIKSTGAHCLFAEPQFDSAVLVSLLRETGVHGGVLDPLGAGLLPGPDSYFHVMREMAFSLRNCLSRP